MLLLSSIAYNEHGGYCVPRSSSHRPAARTVLSGMVFEPETITYMQQNSGAGDIIHAGTYFGDFLPALSRACTGKVWAFEPNRENFRCAEITVLLNGLTNVDLANSGLGEGSGSVDLLTIGADGLPLGGGSRIVDRPDEHPGFMQQASIVSVDMVFPADRNVSILQLDVEGYELPALTGALQTIRRCTPTIIVEHLPEEQWLERNILALGYRIGGKLHANSILEPPAAP